MSALADAQRLVDFVCWEMRTGDLPPDVRDAARRLVGKRPAHLEGKPIRRTEGPLIIDGMTRLDNDGVDRRKAFPHQAGAVIRDLLERGCQYILIQDLSQ